VVTPVVKNKKIGKHKKIICKLCNKEFGSNNMLKH